jgi:molybdenum cofactor biosynthesis enzyme
MSSPFVFAFEELGDELPRPPLAALRLYNWAGAAITLRGWLALRPDQRAAIATEGSREVPSIEVARALLSQAPVRELQLRRADPEFEAKPVAALEPALGLQRQLTALEWGALPPLGRFALNALASNARLAWRAFEELRLRASGPIGMPTLPFRGLVASCEVHLGAQEPTRTSLVGLLERGAMLNGRGMVLARAAGLRAARRVHELFDMHAERECGALELDARLDAKRGVVLWQSHASTWTGEFFSAAALLAATTAASCLFDMIVDVDPSVSLEAARITQDVWRVGPAEAEEATWFRSAPPRVE